MVKCAVSGCPNRKVSYNRGVFNRPPKRFFSFPEDPHRVKVWLAALRETAEEDSAEQRLICEDHFLPRDISKNGLSSDAIPLMPPYLDGSLGLIGPWSVEDVDDQWDTRGCGDNEEYDEGGQDVPASANPPQQSPAGAETSSTPTQKKSSSKDNRTDALLVPLDLLTRRLLELLMAAPGGCLDLRQVATILQTPLQTLCDITSILDGISLVQKESAFRIKWIGWCPISSFLWRSQQTFFRELESLKLVESVLDGFIKSCAQQLFDMTDDEEDSAAAYVTFEDISRLRVCQEKTVVIIKAPKESKLDVPAPKEDSIQVHVKAVNGPIMVMTCEVGSDKAVTCDPAQRSSCFVRLEESRIRTGTLPTAPQTAMQST
ncbi:transcription factor E2F3-like isoform X2 [Parambassis ranga]|uniref:Transcription factor E2F3-like isoform X2 n=1 Tax=Parambassis ranga TaxID=210632 RepID=A0A6P7HB84_9TELE|nr:transcription factor E2F3-like isoform X2 [Parambassis ranga]